MILINIYEYKNPYLPRTPIDRAVWGRDRAWPASQDQHALNLFHRLPQVHEPQPGDSSGPKGQPIRLQGQGAVSVALNRCQEYIVSVLRLWTVV